MKEVIKEKMHNMVMDVTVRIEFSNKNAHWKGNKKCVACYVQQCNDCKHDETTCHGKDCPLLKKLENAIEKIMKELNS